MRVGHGSDTGDGMADPQSDDILIRHVAARDEQSFRVLMQRHMPRAIRLAQRIVNNAAEADDIGQEAFMRVWNHAADFDPERARFTTWLYRIVVNLSVDRARQPRLRPIEEAASVAAASSAPVDAMIVREQEMLLKDAVAALPERQRAAIALFHAEGLSGREAANAMGLSEKAFESLLTRARQSLRQKFEQNELCGRRDV
jgi:RNA polymerase sigma-70 factor (ECF subfamily)